MACYVFYKSLGRKPNFCYIMDCYSVYVNVVLDKLQLNSVHMFNAIW